ncbi:MAG: hypothetical protein WA082_03190 [Candidatus Moraniibacteriota bacterium]
MFASKNRKKNLISSFVVFPLFCVVVFLAQTHVVAAQVTWYNPLSWASAGIGDIFKGLLYGIFVMFGWFASAAITLFGWAINPDYISGPSGLLNRSSVYEMWKFIRDFFNLFFILTLLYTAFTIVFQVAKDYKKTLLSLVLAALFVNFSFPITRVIIDATNVPMYYFVNQLGTTGDGKSSLNTVLSASQLEKILIPNKVVDTDVSQLLMAIVFLFIFSITLVVLAVMFIIRLAALVILLIFSSVGFAAAVIPGLQEYSNKWWKGLWQYALFGPAAMLMLVVATRFFAEIAKDNTVKQFVDTATKSTTPESASFVAAMAMFSIPIIMLWMALGLASSMSIAGAGAVVGTGQKFAKWAGRKTYNNPVGRGLYGGAKKAAMDGNFYGLKYGKIPGVGKLLTGNYWAKPSRIEAAIKGRMGGGEKGALSELEKLRQQEVNEQVKKDKESNLSRSDALARLGSTDEAMRVSAAISLGNMDNGIQSMDDLTKALDALKDPRTGIMEESYRERAVQIVAKTDKKVIAETTDPATGVTTSGLQNLQAVIGSLGDNEKAISDLIAKLDDSAFSGSGADYGDVITALNGVNASLAPALKTKMIKEGRADVLVDSITHGSVDPVLVQTAVDTVLNDIRSTKDMVGNVKLFQNYSVAANTYVAAQSAPRQTEIKKSAAQDSPEVARIII